MPLGASERDVSCRLAKEILQTLLPDDSKADSVEEEEDVQSLVVLALSSAREALSPARFAAPEVRVVLVAERRKMRMRRKMTESGISKSGEKRTKKAKRMMNHSYSHLFRIQVRLHLLQELTPGQMAWSEMLQMLLDLVQL